jgi:DNA-binding transcriptional ArsR family regulator
MLQPAEKKQKPTIARDRGKAEYVAELLKAVAHPLRLRIIAILCEGPEHVNRLAERLDVNQAVVSQQLRILRMRRLVMAAREGGYTTYRIAERHLHQLVDCMEHCIVN